MSLMRAPVFARNQIRVWMCGCVWYARHYKYVLSVCASGVDTLFGFVYVFMCECMRVSVPGGGHMRRFEHATSAVIRYTLCDVISAYDISDPRSSHFQAVKKQISFVCKLAEFCFV